MPSACDIVGEREHGIRRKSERTFAPRQFFIDFFSALASLQHFLRD
jgi:hypothetical protein